MNWDVFDLDGRYLRPASDEEVVAATELEGRWFFSTRVGRVLELKLAVFF